MAIVEVYQGNTQTVDFAFLTAGGLPMNISGYTGVYVARRNYSEPLSSAIINDPITILGDGTTGLAYYTITTGQSSNCSMDYIAGVTLYGPSGDVSTHANDGLRILASPQGIY